jgi:hypothetical protein
MQILLFDKMKTISIPTTSGMTAKLFSKIYLMPSGTIAAGPGVCPEKARGRNVSP